EPLSDLHEARRVAQRLELGGLLSLLLDERLLLADRLAERIAHAQDVDPQRGERERARERDRDQRYDAARRSAVPGARARARAAAEIARSGPPDAGTHAASASATRSAARSRADRERGLRETSTGRGATGRRVSTRRRTRPPQMQTGTWGGQVQPRAASR